MGSEDFLLLYWEWFCLKELVILNDCILRVCLSRNMFIKPSKILFCNSCDLGIANEISLERDIMDLSSALYRGARSPKLQVVKKGGLYFALNDTKLKLYRHLEAIGQCWKVKVKIAPMREVPKGIRN